MSFLKYARLKRFRVGTMSVPAELRQNITRSLRKVSRNQLAHSAAIVAEVLRKRTRARPSEAAAGQVHPKVKLRYTEEETHAYVAHRVPGIYSTASKIMRDVELLRPDRFEPLSMLDFGSGPGTAVFAAVETWPSISSVVALEPSFAMASVGDKLLKDVDVTVERRRYLLDEMEEQHDLVTASYSLSELAPKERKSAVQTLWGLVNDGGLMILVEPGSPVGFKVIKDARSVVIKAGNGNIVAPCPHAEACPMGDTSWCHFKQRTLKTPLQMATKLNSAINYSDERYSYLVVAKEPAPTTEEDNTWHRVLRAPKKNTRHVVLKTCTPEGEMKETTVPKSAGAEFYRAARKAHWGDLIELPEPKPKAKSRYFRKKVVKD